MIMSRTEFADILTDLCYGNRREAVALSESAEYGFLNLSEEYDRRKQDRINYFEVLKLRRLTENS